MKKIERDMIIKYGAWHHKVDRAKDLGSIAGVLAMAIYIIIMAWMDVKIGLPVAITTIGKTMEFYIFMLLMITFAAIVSLLVNYIFLRKYDVIKMYDEYLASRRILRHFQRNNEEEP